MCRCALTLTNLWARANFFHQFHFFRIHEEMHRVLLRMVRGGHFYLAGTWVIPSQGRGMVRRRAEACWRMLTSPEDTCMSDVDAVFFEDCRDRYFTGAADTPSVLAAEPGEGMGDCKSPSVARVFELAVQRCAERAEQGPTSHYHVLGARLGTSAV